MRVQILKDFVKQHFPSTHLLDYALDVEKITTSKVNIQSVKHTFLNKILFQLHWFFFFQKPNLILNVDGFIGVAFVDLLRTCGGFTRWDDDCIVWSL